MILDLHGLNEEEAYAELHAKLLTLDFDPFEEYLDIITGKGWGILRSITRYLIFLKLFTKDLELLI